jgi:hypothetical protein
LITIFNRQPTPNRQIPETANLLSPPPGVRLTFNKNIVRNRHGSPPPRECSAGSFDNGSRLGSNGRTIPRRCASSASGMAPRWRPRRGAGKTRRASKTTEPATENHNRGTSEATRIARLNRAPACCHAAAFMARGLTVNANAYRLLVAFHGPTVDLVKTLLEAAL